jgi:hypothetical protein
MQCLAMTADAACPYKEEWQTTPETRDVILSKDKLLHTKFQMFG